MVLDAEWPAVISWSSWVVGDAYTASAWCTGWTATVYVPGGRLSSVVDAVTCVRKLPGPSTLTAAGASAGSPSIDRTSDPVVGLSLQPIATRAQISRAARLCWETNDTS